MVLRRYIQLHANHALPKQVQLYANSKSFDFQYNFQKKASPTMIG